MHFRSLDIISCSLLKLPGRSKYVASQVNPSECRIEGVGDDLKLEMQSVPDFIGAGNAIASSCGSRRFCVRGGILVSDRRQHISRVRNIKNSFESQGKVKVRVVLILAHLTT